MGRVLGQVTEDEANWHVVVPVRPIRPCRVRRDSKFGGRSAAKGAARGHVGDQSGIRCSLPDVGQHRGHRRAEVPIQASHRARPPAPAMSTGVAVRSASNLPLLDFARRGTLHDMHKASPLSLPDAFSILGALLVWKVVFSVAIGYRDYFPPDFESDFLRGRAPYFWGMYGVAFYMHLFAGPVSLILGTVLVSDRIRRIAPLWHRRLGSMQFACVLLLLAPSGLWMSYYAETGAVAASGLGLLAIATATCVMIGWRFARRRSFVDHRRWMWRTFILLCSAIVIRMIGGLATVAQWDAPWLYPFSTWASWLVPLLVFELTQKLNPVLEPHRNADSFPFAGDGIVVSVDRDQRAERGRI